MKVIICGAGQVGWQIARHLSGEKNDVTVVDYNADLVRRATDTLDVQGVAGFASYPDVLERAGARDADMIIAATHSDEVNMVICEIAHAVFGIPRKIARLRAQSYLDAIYSDLFQTKNLPIDVVISPEKEVAEAALQRLAAPAAFDTESFMGGKAQLLGISLDEDCPVLEHAAAPIVRPVLHAPCHRGRRAPRRAPLRPRSGRSALRRATRSMSSPLPRT